MTRNGPGPTTTMEGGGLCAAAPYPICSNHKRWTKNRDSGRNNRKPKYQGEDGLFPFVKLIEAQGTSYPQAKSFIPQVRQAMARSMETERRQLMGIQPRPSGGPLQTIADFRNRLEYQNDGNRIDLAYSLYALSHGVPESEVRAAVATRDLSHKGNLKRQADYIERTLQKAWTTLRGHLRER